VGGLQQALLSLIVNVTQLMQICSRPCSLSALLRGPALQRRAACGAAFPGGHDAGGQLDQPQPSQRTPCGLHHDAQAWATL